jgi:hypothetical protein
VKRTEPSVNILHKQDYEPSWKYIPRSVVVPYLGGHRGLVRRYRDQIIRNTETASHGPDTDMQGGRE